MVVECQASLLLMEWTLEHREYASSIDQLHNINELSRLLKSKVLGLIVYIALALGLPHSLSQQVDQGAVPPQNTSMEKQLSPRSECALM